MSGFAPYTYGDGAYGDRRDADTLLSMSHETKRRHAEKQKAPEPIRGFCLPDSVSIPTRINLTAVYHVFRTHCR
jgi:hypothetical protein